MGLVAQPNTMPWSVHPGIFITLFAYLLDAVALLIACGVVYALIRGVLTLGDNRDQPETGADAGKGSRTAPFTQRREIPMSINYREGSQHEA